ncbi:MAG: hypothetical protein A2620_06575 [Acidobacteria bacterium RIFCSPHIGHO2_01_FULL_67_28]|nr:MAG: hypothetical protein A2620_06575 [Acidobacteria bacterium RIFCSPHIGHO2_01_FULL_67_28]
MRASRLDPLWADYEAHHRTAGNKWCHAAGIPLILAGLLGLLSVPVLTVEGARVEAALLLIAVMAGLYLWLDARLGAAMLAATLLLYLGARLLDWRAALGLLLAGWILQFIGHGLYEKRSPAFFHNLTHLLVGPLWVLNHALRLRR